MERAKALGIVLILLMAIGPVAAVDMGNKYLVDNFSINETDFNATITNQKDDVEGPGYYEIQLGPNANHASALQTGTFPETLGTFLIKDTLTFKPVNDTKYWILVFTNYPCHDNRVSKDSTTYIAPEKPVDPDNNETNNETNETNNNETPIIPKTPETPEPVTTPGTVPMQTTGTPFAALFAALGAIIAGMGVARLRR